MKYSYAIFDMDGLIFDTERLFMTTKDSVMKEYGYTQQKDDYINDMHTDRAFKVSTPDKKGVPPTPCVSSRVPEH